MCVCVVVVEPALRVWALAVVVVAAVAALFYAAVHVAWVLFIAEAVVGLSVVVLAWRAHLGPVRPARRCVVTEAVVPAPVRAVPAVVVVAVPVRACLAGSLVTERSQTGPLPVPVARPRARIGR